MNKFQENITFFQKNDPSIESQWRALILFGRNTASYKFAFAQALLELVKDETTFISLDELVEPFTRHIINHLKSGKKQITSSSSQFLEACNKFILGEISNEKLHSITLTQGFRFVLDAFQIVSNKEIPDKFFYKEISGNRKGINITDNLFKLKNTFQFQNFSSEVESRWKLVETAWNLNLSPNLLEVKNDKEKSLFYIENKEMRRINITDSRDALNGYQKGKCFFCFDEISIISGSEKLAHVDHFFPHKNKLCHTETNINGIWNLVLSCSSCNLSKKELIPEIKYIQRLHTRNEFFIQSHHPLRETLLNQTGVSESERAKFLQENDKIAINNSIQRWKTTLKGEEKF